MFGIPPVIESAVPITSILAVSVFLIYIFILKFILRPVKPFSRSSGALQKWREEYGYWKGYLRWYWEAFKWVNQFLLPWLIVMCIIIVFTATLYEPSVFSHSFFYDVFLLRTDNNSLAGAHDIDYALVGILFFFCLFYWGKGGISFRFLTSTFDPTNNEEYKASEYIFKAALFSAFLVFFHESIWFFFYYIHAYQTYSLPALDVWVGDITFLVMIFTFLAATRMRYKEEFTPYLGYGALIYGVYCFWWYLTGMRVTTVPIIKGAIPTASVTVWYLNPVVNVQEVFSWIIAFLIVLSVVLLNQRRAKSLVRANPMDAQNKNSTL